GSGFSDDCCFCCFEGADEFAADDLALGLRIGDTVQSGQEAFALVGNVQLGAGGSYEVLFNLLGFAFAQQAVVDEHAGELVTDGALHQGSCNSGVHTAGQSADGLAGADLRADALDLLVSDVVSGPVALQACTVVQEVLQDILAVLAVLDLWVPLHAVQALGLIGESGNWSAGGGCQYFKAFWGLGDGIAVAHPNGRSLCGA